MNVTIEDIPDIRKWLESDDKNMPDCQDKLFKPDRFRNIIYLCTQ